MKMTQDEFARDMANRTGLSITKSKLYTNYVLNTLKDILSEGNEITFIGLGNFYIKKMDDKIIKAPNGKDYMSKKHSIIRFTASPVLNRKLNENINDN